MSENDALELILGILGILEGIIIIGFVLILVAFLIGTPIIIIYLSIIHNSMLGIIAGLLLAILLWS